MKLARTWPVQPASSSSTPKTRAPAFCFPATGLSPALTGARWLGTLVLLHTPFLLPGMFLLPLLIQASVPHAQPGLSPPVIRSHSLLNVAKSLSVFYTFSPQRISSLSTGTERPCSSPSPQCPVLTGGDTALCWVLEGSGRGSTALGLGLHDVSCLSSSLPLLWGWGWVGLGIWILVPPELLTQQTLGTSGSREPPAKWSLFRPLNRVCWDPMIKDGKRGNSWASRLESRFPSQLSQLVCSHRICSVSWWSRGWELAQFLLFSLAQSHHPAGTQPQVRALSRASGFTLRGRRLFSKINWATVGFCDPFAYHACAC